MPFDVSTLALADTYSDEKMVAIMGKTKQFHQPSNPDGEIFSL